MEERIEWITNHFGEDVEDLREDLQIDFEVGRPKESVVYSVEELEDMGVVGIYKIKKEVPEFLERCI